MVLYLVWHIQIKCGFVKAEEGSIIYWVADYVSRKM